MSQPGPQHQTLRDDLTTLVDDAPANPDRLRLVRRRATVLRRRRVAGAAAGVVAVVVAVAVALTSVLPVGSREPTTPVTTPPPLPTGLLLADSHGQLYRLGDLTSKHLTKVAGVRWVEHSSPTVLPDGRLVTRNARHDIVLLDPRSPKRPTLVLRFGRGGYDVPGIGRRQVQRLFPTATGNGLWLMALPVGTAVGTEDRARAEMAPVDLSGRPAGPSVLLPPGAQPLAPAGTGFYATLVQHPGPGAEAVVERFDPAGRATVVARSSGDPNWSDAGSRRAVWSDCTSCSGNEPLRVLDTATGGVTSVRLASPRGFLMTEGMSFSPDGRYAAGTMSGFRIVGDVIQNGWGVLDLATGRVTVVPGSVGPAADGGIQFPVWSGGRLIWQRTTPAGRSVVGGYVPASGEAAQTTLPVKDLRPLGAAG